MRTIYLQPKIYNHRLETLLAEGGFEEQRNLFFEIYDQLKEEETVIYYEYNYPSRSYMTAVLAKAEPFKQQEGGFEKKSDAFERISAVLSEELFKETMRLINELVSREMLSSMGEVDFIEGDDKRKLEEELSGRWQKLPEGIFEPCAAKNFKPLIFRAKLGLRLGCSGGGSCSSCTHPTCGYRSV